MTEPEDTRADREIAVQIAELTSEILLSRSLYEKEELVVRDACGPVVAAYRRALETRMHGLLLAFAQELRVEAESIHAGEDTDLIRKNIIISAAKIEGLVTRLKAQI